MRINKQAENVLSRISHRIELNSFVNSVHKWNEQSDKPNLHNHNKIIHLRKYTVNINIKARDLSQFDVKKRKNCRKTRIKRPGSFYLVFLSLSQCCGDLHDNAIECVKRNSSIAISSSCFSAFFIIRIFSVFFISIYRWMRPTRDAQIHFKSIFNFYFELKRIQAPDIYWCVKKTAKYKMCSMRG